MYKNKLCLQGTPKVSYFYYMIKQTVVFAEHCNKCLMFTIDTIKPSHVQMFTHTSVKQWK